jgi:hypothetical protein
MWKPIEANQGKDVDAFEGQRTVKNASSIEIANAGSFDLGRSQCKDIATSKVYSLSEIEMTTLNTQHFHKKTTPKYFPPIGS